MTLVRNRSPFYDFDSIFEAFGFMKCPGLEFYKPKENEDGYYFMLPIPGLSKDDVKVKLENNLLTISYSVDDDIKSHFVYSNYQKSFTLPKNADLESVKAVVENGVLAVTIKKLEEVNKFRQIEVK